MKRRSDGQLGLYEIVIMRETLMVSSRPPVHSCLILSAICFTIRFRRGGAQRGRWNNNNNGRGAANAKGGG